VNRWFLPQSPDVLAILGRQAAVTQEAMAAFVAWAQGDEASALAVRELEHAADHEVRALRRALRVAFTTPVDAEDLYVLSWRLDRVLNGAKNTIMESEVMATPPDEALAAMAAAVAEAVDHLAAGLAHLDADGEEATASADAAIKCCRAIERHYRAAMSSLIDLEDLRVVIARRELYRRVSRLGGDIVEVAERVWYAVVKEA